MATTHGFCRWPRPVRAVSDARTAYYVAEKARYSTVLMLHYSLSTRRQQNNTFWNLVFSLSGNITYTNRPQGVNCRGYLHVLKYLLFISRLLYLRRMEWCRRISLQTSSCDTFMKLSRFDVCKSTLLHHSFLLKYRVGQKTGLFLRWDNFATTNDRKARNASTVSELCLEWNA